MESFWIPIAIIVLSGLNIFRQLRNEEFSPYSNYYAVWGEALAREAVEAAPSGEVLIVAFKEDAELGMGHGPIREALQDELKRRKRTFQVARVPVAEYFYYDRLPGINSQMLPAFADNIPSAAVIVSLVGPPLTTLPEPRRPLVVMADAENGLLGLIRNHHVTAAVHPRGDLPTELAKAKTSEDWAARYFAIMRED